MFPDLASLSLFLKAVDARSLSRAAEKSHIALSAASRRIAALERQYGVSLLDRVPGGVEPTIAGQAMAEALRRLFDDFDKLKVEMWDYAEGSKGRVRLDASPAEIGQTLPNRLAEFLVQYPDIRVDLREKGSAEIVRAIRDRLADVGIITAGVQTAGLAVRAYRPDRLCVVVPRDHALRSRTLAFKDAVTSDFIGLDDSAAFTQLINEAAADIGHTVRWRVQVRSYEAMCRLIHAGLGIGLMSEGVAEVFRQPLGLRKIRLTDAWAERRMQIVTLSERVAGPSRLMIDFLLNTKS